MPATANKIMTRVSNSNLTTAMSGLLAAHRDEPLEAALVYEDSSTRQWTSEVYARLERLAGEQSVRSTSWNVGDFCHAGVLAGAVSKAMRAELIVVALRASEGLPLPFYFWVNAWLPHHLSGTGLLLGLLGATAPRQPEAGRVREYLRNVAHQGRLKFLLQERRFEQPSRVGLNCSLLARA
jgi:hypothetical protein